MTPWELTARELLEEARRAAGGGSALAAALKDAGVSPDSGAYSESAVSNWIKGRTRPHADVLLAACSLYGLSLDARLPGTFDHQPQRTSMKDIDLVQMRSDLDRVMVMLEAGAPGKTAGHSTQDVVAAYPSRADAFADQSLVQLIAPASRLDLLGISLNMLCQGSSDGLLLELLEGGLHVRALFLDPDCGSTRQREQHEGLAPGTLRDLTRTNLAMLHRTRDRLSTQAKPRLEIRTYDWAPDANLTIIDGSRAYAQFYLSQTRGNASPTIVCESNDHFPRGLFPMIESKFTDTWEAAR